VIQTVREQFLTAIYLIVGSAILDGVDGTIARLTRTESSFGVQLDSLVDAVAFGLVPGFLIYRWGFMESTHPALGQVIGFLFLSAGVIRLARFNVMKDAELTPSGHFVGLPIPLGALSVASPIMLVRSALTDTWDMVLFMLYVLLISLLMISNIKYRNLKHVDSKYNLPILLGVAILLSLLVLFPKVTLPAMVVVYITSPFFFWLFMPKKTGHDHAEPHLEETLPVETPSNHDEETR
jgi:CDP-diacylglycerol--serine O-phosphatidyltransferase